jgi:hypothetical protein
LKGEIQLRQEMKEEIPELITAKSWRGDIAATGGDRFTAATRRQ